MTKRFLARRGWIGALAITLWASLAIARQFRIGADALAASDAALSQKDVPAAIAAARQAAKAIAPASPYPARGYTRLLELAQQAEAQGDRPLAATAWYAMRAAASATRTLGLTNHGWRTRANEGIVRTASLPHRDPAAADRPAMTRETLAALVDEEDTPTTGCTVLFALGAVLGGVILRKWIQEATKVAHGPY